MKKLLVWLTTWILLFIVMACGHHNKPRVQMNQADSALLKMVEQRIEEKKELQKIRLNLERSNLMLHIDRYLPLIKKYAKRYGFDYRLIIAQIIQESGFKMHARSRVGARGLMQIMPGTARELSRELDIEYILLRPRENITAGIYHLYKQTQYFPDAPAEDRLKLALASYNAGAGRVFDAQDIARYFKQPINQWESVKPYLAMLKKTDWQLHLQVWPTGRPPHGYFYGYEETISYVENIWNMYQVYRKIL
ncbi:MAG: transglycosylase SLT domain-containing protein [Caldisericaceae bacterium]|nr:transglycosylase SLT domain-containing protein [Caldisericaceae bacterium]